MLTFNSATIHAISQVFHRYSVEDAPPGIELVTPEDIWEEMHAFASDPDVYHWSTAARAWAASHAFEDFTFRVARALIEAVEGAQ